MVKDFAREAFVRKGYAVDIAIHAPNKEADQRNHHAHLMVRMRTIGPEGFAAKKDRSLNSTEQLGTWREQWAHLANRHLERHGHEERIDHRSYKARGVDQEPTVHLGYAANEMAARGAQSDRMDELQGVLARNELRNIEAEPAPLELLHAKHLQAEGELARARVFRAEAKAAGLSPGELAQQNRNERQEARQEAQQEAWRASVDERNRDKGKLAEKGLQVIDSATGALSKLGDFVSDLLAGSPPPAAEKPADMKAFVTDPEACKQQQLARFAAKEQESAAEKAIERIAEDMKAGKALSSSDIKSLTPAHQMQIKNFGDDAVKTTVNDAEKRAQQFWKDGGRERERGSDRDRERD